MTFPPLKEKSAWLPRLWCAVRERRGNVAIIVALVLAVLIFGIGMGVDYTLANRRQDQINGFADAAALAAVTPSMMSETDANAVAAAQAMFASQLATVSNITYSPSNISITATDTGAGNTVNRVITISYTANSTNAFGAVLGMPSIPIAGSASAKSSVAPKIDFYLLLDTSPSMAIAATPSGISTMVANTSHQGGCAFGCHQSNPAADNLQNPAFASCPANPATSYPAGGEDNFALARCLGVALRIDNVAAATAALLTTAQTTAATNHTDYRAALLTMDLTVNQLIGITDITTNLTSLQNAAANIQALEVYDNNCLTASNCNNDQDSMLDNAILNLAGPGTPYALPAPGNGTSNPGDTPQEVLFIVTDGVNDEQPADGAVGQTTSSGGRIYGSIDHLISPDQCTAIKNRGIRIAFLYLTYYPLTTNGWYNSYISPFQFPNRTSTDQIAVAAQNCASPGLYFAVDTGGDISAAMTALFQKAVATAHLTH